MTIAPGKTVSIEYTLTLDANEVVDTNVDREPLTYTHGDGGLIAGLEDAMEGMTVGESKKVTVQPEAAYGEPDPEAFVEVPRDHLPPEAWEIGVQVGVRGPQGQEINGLVAELKENSAVVDFNHPLAGKVLNFDIKVLEIK